MKSYRRGFIIVILSSIIVPVVVGSLKAVTNMPCPKNVETFSGAYPHTCVWEKYTSKECHLEKQKCWPAGHASGGFALLSLIFLFHSRRNKILVGVVAMLIGWSMGSYKMLIGDHFLSHTVITMILAWLLILIIVRGVDWVMQRKLKIIPINGRTAESK
jgi:membrane-associated PAP2 superfamily phosphatase